VQIVEERGRPDSSGNPSALVLCEYSIHRFALHPNSAVVDFTFSPVWVVDRTNVSLHNLFEV
jgi:hypothetical protein